MTKRLNQFLKSKKQSTPDFFDNIGRSTLRHVGPNPAPQDEEALNAAVNAAVEAAEEAVCEAPEQNSSIFLFNNKTVTLTIGTYQAISLGSYGTASAFATVTTIVTVICLVAYLFFTRGSERMSV